MYFFDIENHTFLVEGLHTIPETAIAVSEEAFSRFINARSQGCEIYVRDGQLVCTTQKPSPLHHWQNGQWLISPEKQAELLKTQQAEVWEKIKQRRYENGLGGVFIPSVSKWFQTGEEEKTKYLGLDKVIDKLGEINWKCADNTFVKMNRALLDEIFLMMVKTENADHINAEKHRLAMLAAENPLTYDFSTGWSAIYQEQTNG